MILYLHIPFCHRICPYCSFYKHTPANTDIPAFLQAILSEAASHAPLSNTRISTLYLGGGTPSMLSPAHLRTLFNGLHDILPLDHTHITLEANPATFNHTKAALFKELGVNRVSLGIQSFSPHVLQTLGREHSPEQARESVRILQDIGMDEINIDLMFSIPGQSLDDWKQTLHATLALNPDHISAYNLTYEQDTPFFKSLQQGNYSEDEDTNADMFSLAHSTLTAQGYAHYETSNYAKPGKQSTHNLAYWQGQDYLGLGPSAVSTHHGRRWKNIPDTARYIHAIETVGHAKTEEEIIDASAYRTERIALLLRTTQGLPEKYLTDSPKGAVQNLLDHQLAEFCDHHLRLINDGPMLVDPIAAQLL